mmetsp:Transcript_24854/g.86568  ORF Transcript_24854/g.86568 Transcript_24854/m.86568 type:complete len:312 (-) Transcript_24854:145-1080(-)
MHIMLELEDDHTVTTRTVRHPQMHEHVGTEAPGAAAAAGATHAKVSPNYSRRTEVILDPIARFAFDEIDARAVLWPIRHANDDAAVGHAKHAHLRLAEAALALVDHLQLPLRAQAGARRRLRHEQVGDVEAVDDVVGRALGAQLRHLGRHGGVVRLDGLDGIGHVERGELLGARFRRVAALCQRALRRVVHPLARGRVNVDDDIRDVRRDGATRASARAAARSCGCRVLQRWDRHRGRRRPRCATGASAWRRRSRRGICSAGGGRRRRPHLDATPRAPADGDVLRVTLAAPRLRGRHRRLRLTHRSPPQVP